MTNKLDKFPLMYEEISDREFAPSCEGPVNNAQCENDAVTEWVKVDEEDFAHGDGPTYSTFRCDEHDVTEPGWEPRPL